MKKIPGKLLSQIELFIRYPAVAECIKFGKKIKMQIRMVTFLLLNIFRVFFPAGF